MRIFCIGRNYQKHAEELGNQSSAQPVIFIKPMTSLVFPDEPVIMPSHGSDLQHEVEVVIRIGKAGRATRESDAMNLIESVTLGLDLTLRDVQNKLQAKGLPWECAKAFDYSAPIGNFTKFKPQMDLANIEFRCSVNGEVRQKGSTADMIHGIPKLIIAVSRLWNFQPGDLIYTGTPAGVGSLVSGDNVVVESPDLGRFSWTIV